jgi:hypothetical protein
MTVPFSGRKGQRGSVGRTLLIVLLVVAIVLLLVRLALPHILVWYINRTIDDLPDYHGRVESAELGILRGAATLKDISLVKRGEGIDIPFASVPEVHASIEWNRIMQGQLIGAVEVRSPRINLVAGKEEAEDQLEIGDEWADTARRLMPMRVDEFRVTDAVVHYIDPTSDPEVDIYLDNLQVTVLNLANTRELQAPRFATVEATARAMESGEFRMSMDLDPLADDLRFEMEAELEDLDLTTLNDFLEAYGRFDVKQGRFSLFMEVAAEEGRFKGYLRPFFEDVEVLTGEEIEKGLLRFAWEALVAGAKTLLESPGEEDQVATRIPISGEFEDPEVGIWETVINLLRNGFIQALSRGLEGSVGLEDVPEE